MADLFERADRMKLRISCARGVVAVEDLWDLSLSELDEIAMDLNRQVEAAGRTSFVKKTSDVPEKLEVSFGVVKHIIDVKLAENEAVKNASERKLKKDRLLAIIADKQDRNLEKKSIADLTKMVEDL